MEELLSMGFSEDLSSQALAANPKSRSRRQLDPHPHLSFPSNSFLPIPQPPPLPPLQTPQTNSFPFPFPFPFPFLPPSSRRTHAPFHHRPHPRPRPPPLPPPPPLRVALNSLEASAVLALNRTSSIEEGAILVTSADAKEAMQCKHLAYDRDGEEHYNLISALHKSMRGSDADAAVYWLARMLEGGEQPLYIARRLVRFASEDVGLADPSALGHAVACYQACHFIGMPECDVCLAQCVSYLALAPKSVAVYRALGDARRAVRESAGGNEGVPLHLRNAPTKLMEEMGYGDGYLYPPDHHPQLCEGQSYLPDSLKGRRFLRWPPLDVERR